MTDAEPVEAGFREEALVHLDAVYRFALRLTGSPDRAEDLVQETFLRAYRAWERYERGTRARSWLFTIARNVFLRQEERGKRHDDIVRQETRGGLGGGAGRDIDVVNPVWVSTMGRDPEGEFFDSIVDDEVLRAVDGLPEEFRTPLVLSDVEGLSYQEIAELMSVPVGTVKSRLFRARRRLQQELYEFAVEMGYLRPRAPMTGGDA
ncbi:MAG: sigma-70 family RNA polymerase sigma factor [Gemmatimonadota bacterium]